MITTRFLSHTFALRPNFSWKMPIVPGPHTSWVMRMSTFTQTFSSGETRLRPLCLARIFSVIVMPAMCKTPGAKGENRTPKYSGEVRCVLHDSAQRFRRDFGGFFTGFGFDLRTGGGVNVRL